MSGIRVSMLAAALALAGLAGFGAFAEEGAEPGAKPEKAEKAGKADKGKQRGEGMDQIRAVFEKLAQERRAFTKELAEKAKETYKGLAGKDGAEVSTALVALYTAQYESAKAFLTKQKTTFTTELNATQMPDQAKTKAVEKFEERQTAESKRMEERQQERLAFAKSLSGLSAEEVKTAVQKHMEELRAKMEQRREEMGKKEGKPEGKAEGGEEGKKGGRPGRPMPGDDLLGPDFGMMPPAGKGGEGKKPAKAEDSAPAEGN